MTDQKPTDVASASLSLQGFEVAYVEIRPAPTRANPSRRIKVLGLCDVRGFHVCSECSKKHSEAAWQEFEPRRFRECSIGDFETYLEITPWRLNCCGGTRVESFPWEAPGHRMTQRFFERIAALCTRLPVQEVASMAGLSWDTVARVDKKAIELGLGGRQPDLGKLQWVGVDEVSRTGGHDYFTIVTNLRTGAVVHIGDGKGKKGLQSFLERLSKSQRKRIQGTASDLGYLNLLRRAFPKANHVLDRFHIVKWVNDALNALRREEFGAAPRIGSGKVIKAKKWMLLSGREKLEQNHKLELAKLMKLNRRLYRGYLLKEELRTILKHPWQYMTSLRKNLQNWCNATIRSRLEPLKQVARRLRPHFDAIVAAYDAHIPLGLVEEINGKIANLRRVAHGYKDREYFKLKIYQRCSLPDNPWRRIVV